MPSSTATKATPSPAPIVKYQPPLMRFLRSSTSSKSTRVRSRAIPHFTRRKRSAINGNQQEPSSPKVTCIGQVRIRRSSSKTRQSGPPPLKRRSSSSDYGTGNWFIPICCSFRFGRRKNGCLLPVWRNLVSFLCCKSDRVRKDPVQIPIPAETCVIYTESESGSESRTRFEEDEEEETEAPPRNALFLTRCRSAPQRSSCLASQFWGSPLKTEGEDKTGEVSEEEVAETESVVAESKKTETITVKGYEEEKQSKEEEEEEEKIVVLRRCKSEPLSSSAWREMKLESSVSCRNSVERECKRN